MSHSLRLSGCPHANQLTHFSLKCTLRACTVSLMLRDLFVTWINALAITDHWQKLHYITTHVCVTLTVEEQNRSTYAHDVTTDTLQFPDKSASSLARWNWQCLPWLGSTQRAIRNEGSLTSSEIIHNYYKDDKFYMSWVVWERASSTYISLAAGCSLRWLELLNTVTCQHTSWDEMLCALLNTLLSL